jgi:hypothetical protein
MGLKAKFAARGGNATGTSHLEIGGSLSLDMGAITHTNPVHKTRFLVSTTSGPSSNKSDWNTARHYTVLLYFILSTLRFTF